MSIYSYGHQQRRIASEEAMPFDPRTAHVGDLLDYPTEDVGDDVWDEAIRTLRGRGLRLADNWGDGYVVAATTD